MNSCHDDPCQICRQQGIELKVLPCNCSFHTKCFPLNHLIENSQSSTCQLRCPSCNSTDMKGIYLIPIDINGVKDSFVLTPERKTSDEIPSMIGSMIDSEPKCTTDLKISSAFEEVYLALAPLFLFESEQTSYNNIDIAEDVEIRNGRWTAEEIEYIECLINAFKDGNLLVCNGMTLNNFLRSIFMCKSTRLRKKIKHAKFCTSTYCIQNKADQPSRAVELAIMQERFLHSLDDDNKKILLKFSMSRMWRTHFFNLCMHIGYESIIAQDWLDSLEEIEDKVRSAKESKKMRERRNRVADIATSNSSRAKKYSLDRSNHSIHSIVGTLKPISEHKEENNIILPPNKPDPLDFSSHSYGFSRMSLLAPQEITSMPTIKNVIVANTAVKQVVKQNMMIHSFNHSDHPMSMMSHTDHAQTPRNGEATRSQDFEQSAESQHSPGTRRKRAQSYHSISIDSFQGKGLPIQPLLVPLEIKEVKESAGNTSLSDVSEGESFCKSFSEESSPALPNTQYSNSTLEKIEDVPSAKRSRNDGFDSGLLIFDADPVVDEVQADTLLDLSDVCDKFGDWSPFIKKIANVIESENLPFEYFDVWVASSDDASSGNDQNREDSDTILRHVGHSARNNGSIWTLYHMNEFGKLSSTFTFKPGEGLPGRVFESGQPLWDDSVQSLPIDQFPRLEGAKIHGIKKALGIPVFHTPLGKIVVALYSSHDIAKDEEIVQKCCSCNLFGNVFNPKWELVLDVGNSAQVKGINGIPRSVSAGVDISAIDQDLEQHIANVLAKHTSIGVKKDNLSERLSFAQTSLRLLLLRPPSKRSLEQNSSVDLIKASYQNYLKANQNERDITALLIREWSFLNHAQPKKARSPYRPNTSYKFLRTSSVPMLEGLLTSPSNVARISSPGAATGTTDTESIALAHTNYSTSRP